MNVPIFISYRRADAAAEAGRLHSTILRDLGEDSVFMDTSAIELGALWSKELETALDAAQIVIVIIGPEWLRISDKFGFRRIDQEGDWVRQEIEAALQFIGRVGIAHIMLLRQFIGRVGGALTKLLLIFPDRFYELQAVGGAHPTSAFVVSGETRLWGVVCG
ncbi:MAG: TIR domain-containing protein [Leptolyngbyaceae cyanobacterium RM2_2_21]|nr:TIR domain-containing protein [Leptolyngbyaceae cyanobacterium RM2_2_21]